MPERFHLSGAGRLRADWVDVSLMLVTWHQEWGFCAS
jgi:hypothetical protein